jgi:hypothetical protein
MESLRVTTAAAMPFPPPLGTLSCGRPVVHMRMRRMWGGERI